MRRTRVIPVLLLSDRKLVKTIKFSKPVYVGDPINSIKIFNDKEVDELAILDIKATKKNISPDFGFLKEFASECFIPLCYGGGLASLKQMEQVFKSGVEKVSINTQLLNNTAIISEASKYFGSQSIVASLDIKKTILGERKVYSYRKKKYVNIQPAEFAKNVEQLGVGEILLNSVDRDGTGLGYDLDLIKAIANSVAIPVIACGGAATANDFSLAVQAGASAVAAGSMFVFHGKHNAVLINYPNPKKLSEKLP